MKIKREEVLEARRQFKKLNPRNTPLPMDLFGEWGKYCTLQWVSEQIQNQIDEEGNDANITEDEINMSRDVKERYIYKSHKIFFYKTLLILLTI